MPLQPGTRLGNYEVLSELGSGGMGEVYKARDLKLGREVAIKVLPQEMASDSQRLRRFEQEARAASALNHPNIVTIYEIGEHEGTPYIAMEYVDGVTLREMLSDGEPLPTKKLLKLSTQIADGLAKAHSAGIVHRDLKPENLMVTQDGFIKILDFGLAKLVAESSGAESKTVTKATQEGAVLGTVQYMSPEQAAGRPVDYRSDQFSLGSILYEMATGKLAYLRETGPETQAAIMRDEPEPITVLNPHVPAQLTHIIERCLEKEPHERYDSTRDLARDLESVDALGTAPQASSSGSRRLLLAGVSGFVLVVTLVVMTLFTGDMRDWIAGDKGPPRIESIAVLPLENLSGDPEQEYFADGMTDELIAELAQIGALKVISRTSIMQYKEARKSLPEIARELDVDAIVEGTVRRAEGRVRITAQLIRAETDQHLWAESYDRELLDILSLQSEVARAIAQEVQVRLTPQEVLQLANTRPVNAEAHEAYLRGRYFWNEAFGTPRAIKLERLNAALESFRQAIALDAGYARGYAGLAETYVDLANSGLKPASEVYPLAERAASDGLGAR